VTLTRLKGGLRVIRVSNFVIQSHPAEYHDFVRYLDGIEFRRIVLHAPGLRFKGTRQILWECFCGGWQLLRHLDSLRGAQTVVAFSHFAFVVKLLARLGLVRYQRLFCFGFFLHDPRWFRIFRWVVRLDRPNDHYVIFSRREVDLYRSQLGIPHERLHFVPLGDWSQIRHPTLPNSGTGKGDYYFAGGRSNREYVALVEAFRSIPARLVIVCSRSNWKELEGVRLPPNVQAVCDVPIATFDEYVRGAKAGIITLKRDTGASGQSVALALMRNAKCIIATDVEGLREYIEHGVSGYLMRDLTEELPALVQLLERDPGRAEAMGRAARERYEQHLSRDIAAAAFESVLRSTPLKSVA
jgi:glycosyltransferase involved in cell wall biosynthesis